MGAVRFGEFTFDSEARILTRNGDAVHLTPKAFDLLSALIEARPRALRKEELREKLWPDVVVDESNLKSLVAEVRAALGNTRAIRTVHRYGYAFAAEAQAPTPASLIDGDRIHRLHAGSNVIGRADQCAVVLDFTGVSRRHATITVNGDQCVIEDLDSKNGTWKNDERVHGRVDLADGDRIRLGPMSLVFRSSSRPLTTPTVPG